MSAVRIPRDRLQVVIETLQRHGGAIAREELDAIVSAIADAPIDGDDVVVHLDDGQKKAAAFHIATAADGWNQKLCMLFSDVEPSDELLDGHLDTPPTP